MGKGRGAWVQPGLVGRLATGLFEMALEVGASLEWRPQQSRSKLGPCIAAEGRAGQGSELSPPQAPRASTRPGVGGYRAASRAGTL